MPILSSLQVFDFIIEHLEIGSAAFSMFLFIFNMLYIMPPSPPLL